MELADAENTVQCVLDEVLIYGADLLYDHYINSLSMPYAVASVTALLENAVESSYLRHDIGESSVYELVAEPTPCAIDTWARNAIPTKRKAKLRPVQELSSQNVALDNKSMRSVRSGVTTKNPRGLRSMTSNVNTINEQLYRPIPIETTEEEISEEEELMRQRKDRQHNRKKEELERMKQIKEEEDQRQRKLSKEAEELKKKPFTYDNKGQPIIINPPKLDKMPPMAMHTLFEIQGTEQKVLKSRREQEMASARVKKQVPSAEQEWVKNMTSVQPPMIDSIKLAPGVTLIQDKQSKFAPLSTTLGTTLTRAQYRQTARREPLLASSQPVLSKKETIVISQPSLRETPVEEELKEDLFEAIPEYESVIQEIEEEFIHSHRKVLVPAHSQHKVTTYSKDFNSNEMTPIDRFNLEILANRNWGINPPTKQAFLPKNLPTRPSEKTLHETHASILKKPKDQPFISSKELWQVNNLRKPRDRPFIERVESKKHSPAPPLGHTMTHEVHK